ncbi:MFS transporter [Betaproteobacteria bacterium PRO7]|jgi:MFS family permease|nr:MFS transporter [Burkholderiaceae bacterium]MDL1861881.1 MFS transporter [Betaproteobacteria bacterium PRO7]
MDTTRTADAHRLIDSPAAWRRLAASLAIATFGGVGMWSVVVALPAVQADFGVDRGSASLPYTLTMVGFGFGGILMGRLSDRHGIALPLAGATLALAAGYLLAGLAPTLFTYALAQGVLIGALGSSAMFGPLLADISHWFERRRGLAVAITASGNYLAGTVWPPLVQQLIESVGWRSTHMIIGVVCLVAMLPLTFVLRKRSPYVRAVDTGDARRVRPSAPRPLGLSPNALQTLLVIAGLACCVAMSMPQVHIVAYCGDLGYGPAAGAQMLSLMLGFGIVSRLLSGWIADHIGGLRTLLLGSALQGVALVLYVPFDGLASLYLISALFGLFQGGIVPSYAIIVREYFAPHEAGARVGWVVMATLFGMALGGWMSGAVFDLTGSYRAAFVNGIAWNVLNLSIVLWLLMRARSARAATAGA